MRSTPPHDPALALRNAYRDLSEETKRRISRAMLERRPADFELLSKLAKTGYHNLRTASLRPPGVGRKLDEYFLRTQTGYALLRRATTAFFFSDKLQWVDHLRVRVRSESPLTIGAKVGKVLAADDAPWRGDPLEQYFYAASLARPTDWLPDGADPTPAKPETQPAADTVPVEERPAAWVGSWRDFCDADREIAAALEIARAAHPFDHAKIAGRLEALARTSEALRTELASMAAAAGEPAPTWKTAAEFKAMLERLGASLQNTQLNVVRRDLSVLADRIEGLNDTGSRTVRKREEVEKARVEAVAELRAKAGEVHPVVLAGARAESWLQSTFALTDAALDGHLRELERSGLPKLAAFVIAAESLTRFSVREPVVPPPASPAEFVPRSVQAPQPKVEGVATYVIPTDGDKGPVHGDAEPPLDAGPSQILPFPAAAEAAGAAPRPEISPDAAPGWSGCVDVLSAIDELEEARVLLPDVVDAQPTELVNYLPALELWRAVACQPWLGEKESDAHEILRQDFATLLASAWSARTEFEAILAWSAAIYPAFLGTTPQANGLLYQLTQNKNLPAVFVTFTRQTVTFLEAVPHCSPEGILTGTMHSGWADVLTNLRNDIVQFCDAAAQQTLNYQKATMVWRKVNAPGGRLREIAQRASGKQTQETIRKLRADADDLLGAKVQQRLIETVGRSMNSNFPYIDGAALEQLGVRFDEFARRVQRFCDHALREPKEQLYFAGKVREFSEQALPMLRALVQPSADARNPSIKLAHRIARRAAGRVISLFEGRASGRMEGLVYGEAIVDARLRMVGLPLDPRAFSPAEGREEDVRTALRPENFQPVEAALKRRLADGQIACARRLLERLGARGTTPEWTLALEEARERDLETCFRELEDVRRDVLNARTLSVMSESDAQAHLTQLAAAQGQVQAGDDFSVPLRAIRRIKGELHELTTVEAKKLQEEVVALPASPVESRDRVGRLLQSGDLATAREYITRLKSGMPLPPLGLDPPLGGFTQQRQAEIAGALSAAHEFDGLIAKVQARAEFAGTKFDSLPAVQHKELVEWLQTWRALRSASGLDREMVLRWLGGLGFRPLEVRIHSAGSEIVADVKMHVTADRAICPVPQFGSETKGNYRLVHLTKRQDPGQYLQILRQAGGTQAVILLAAYRVEPQVRLEYARICRENRLRGLLVDEVLIAHLAGFNSGRLAAMFRATLPYTWVDPYVPTSSFVPPEMFFGRADAMDALLDMSKQRCFVYGGRQLGKTALLREVERRFPSRYEHGTGLWIDLQAEDFGRKAEPEEIWKLLCDRFCEKLAGFEALWRDTKGAQHGRLDAALSKWLQRDPQRLLLLLLDESDRFLDRDAVQDFAETRRLKDLMGRWSGRLKIVFAGLHNVQRSTRQANHPLAHLGDSINVGAFSQNGEWMEAYALVAGPLAALGFKFESADLPSRVLAACNFYPSLLQQFGHRLLERFRSHPRNAIPRVIDAEAIDAVIREDEFRRFMTDRFQLTLQLDRRYYYIAYAFALFFHGEADRAIKGYTPAELRDKMEFWRPVEFATIGHEEFDTLLDEMRGLGILQRGEDLRYRLRNTNVLLLLGTSDEVLRRLAEDVPDLRVDYQSQTHRGRVVDNRRRLLTRPEENRLLAPSHRLSLVSCAPIAESATIEETLRAVAGHDHFHFVPATSAESVQKDLENLAGQKLENGTHVVLLDHRQKDGLPCADTIRLAREFVASRSSKVRFFSVVVRVPVGVLWDLEMRPWMNATDIQLFIARRWEQEFVGPWLQDQSFNISAHDLTELMAVTDGWPRLLHAFADEHRANNSWLEATESVRRKVDRWTKEPGAWTKFAGEGPAAADAWKNLRELHDIESGTFSGADIAPYADLQKLSPTLMQHWIDVASRLGLLDRTTQTYRWNKVVGRILAGK